MNSDFEQSTGSAPLYWTKNVSTATLSISPIFKNGANSAAINKTNNSTGSIYAYQDVDVEEQSYYTLSGSVVKNSANFAWVVLRISWRAASLVEKSQTDSPKLTSDSPDFQGVSIDSVQAPPGVAKARIELVANIINPNPANPVLFDDISFSQISPPQQSQSTPVEEPTDTVTPTNTPTPKLTPTPTPKVTLKPSVKPSPSVQSKLIATKSGVLGESSESAIIQTPTVSSQEIKIASDSGNNLLPKLLIAIGIVFLIACAIVVSYPYLKNLIEKNINERRNHHNR